MGLRTRTLPARGGATIRIEDHRTSTGAPPVEDKEQSKIERLFSSLGGEGRIKVYRVVDGREKYVESLEVSEDLIDRLEETITARFGGGEYWLKGFANKTCVACAQISIDEERHPPKQSLREKTRDGAAEPTTAAEWLDKLERARREEREALTRQFELEKAHHRSELALALDASKNQMNLVLGLLGAVIPRPGQTAVAAAAPAAPAAADPFAQLRNTMVLLNELRDQAGSDNQSLGERLLTPMVTKFGEKVGSRVADMIGPAGAPAQTAAPTPPPKPTLENVKLPPGAKPLTDEQLATLRQRSRVGAATVRPPGAPRASEVLGGGK